MRADCRLPLVLMALIGLPAAAQAQDPTAESTSVRLRVEGPLREDGSLVASEVSRLPWRGAAATVRGPVTAIDPESGQLSVLDVTVTASPTLRLEGGPTVVATLAGIRPGDVVEVDGFWLRPTLRAWRITLVSPASRMPARVMLDGPADVQDGDGYVLLGHRAWLPVVAARLDEQSAAAGTSSLIGPLRRAADDQQSFALEQQGPLRIGGRVDTAFIRQFNFDLDTEGRDDVDETTSRAQVQAHLTLPAGVEAFAKIQGSHNLALQDLESEEKGPEVSEAFVSWEIGGGPVSLHAGRQRFRDQRGWFVDSKLDAIRVELSTDRWQVEAAVAEGIFTPADARRRRELRHLIGSVGVTLGPRTTFTARAIARDDRRSGDHPVWVGISAHGAVTRYVEYWSDAAWLRGRANETTLRGMAFDTGATVRGRSGWRPSVTIAYAMGTGHRGDTDDADTAFEPTRLESTSYRIAGLKWFHYYGEVLDPELSNIGILTAAVGVRSAVHVSLEVAHHHYRQLVLSRRLPRNDLHATGTGASSDVGRGLDVVLTLRYRPFDFSIIGGVFLPGAAIDAAHEPAFLIKPQVRFYF